jgi:hypothetical protein
MADLSDKANLSARDISPILALALLNLQELMLKTEFFQLAFELASVTPVILIGGIKATDHYFAFTHGAKSIS